jgi:DNA-binding Lrp family transcriptional regulator
VETNAYILLSVDPQRTDEVVKRLSAISRALVRQVLGPYDVIVELSEDTVTDITRVVQAKIRPVQGVTQTVTCVWIQASSQGGGE